MRAARILGTPWLRDDHAANSGADPVGHRNEQMVMCLGMVIMYVDMEPRSHSDPAPDPNSAYNKILGVVREHNARGITMVDTVMCRRVLRGMMRAYAVKHGVRSPKRKKPFTQEIYDGCRAVPCLLYTSPSPRDATLSRMPSSA